MDNIVSARVNDRKWFDTAHLHSDLKIRSVKGGFNTIFGQVFSFALSMTSTVVLARLLAPESFGLVAMVTAITGFVTIFKDLGLSAAVIQREDIDQQQVSGLFWVNLLISLVIALIIAAMSPLLADFYDEPRIVNITLAFAVSIFIAGLSLQHNALMKRQMQFKKLSQIQVFATALSVLMGIALALLGWGYWAVVAVTAAHPVFSTILLWIACDWRPDFFLKLKEINSFLKFGAGITGFDMINYFSRNADNILIGRFIGSLALGLYSKAYQLLMLPITQLRDPLNTVALPALSALKSNHDKYKSFYGRYLFLLSFFYMPIVVCLSVFSEEFILLILGRQWTEAAPIFQLLGISALIQPAASTKGIIMISMGMTKKYFHWGIVNAVFTVTGFAIGINWGVEGVALSYIIVNYLILIPSLKLCFKGSPVTLMQFAQEIKFPLIFSLLSGSACYLFKTTSAELSPISILLIGTALGAAVYLLPWFLSNTTRVKISQVAEIRKMLGK